MASFPNCVTSANLKERKFTVNLMILWSLLLTFHRPHESKSDPHPGFRTKSHILYTMTNIQCHISWWTRGGRHQNFPNIGSDTSVVSARDVSIAHDPSTLCKYEVQPPVHENRNT